MRLMFLSSLLLSVTLVSCGGSSGGRGCVGDSSALVTISGKITFDRVPLSATGSLNYDNSRRDPVRGATVEFIARDGSILDSTQTDGAGNYSLPINANTEMQLRVLAELARSDGPTWQVSVTDNTQGNALYTLQGSPVCSGTSDNVRDLHASSGWTGAGYAQERQAAPFAILDSAYDVLTLLASADPDIALSPIELRWSPLNVAIFGNPFIGEIGTSSFRGDAIFILGDENNDTDEYDNSVVQHEFTHFLENEIFRSDSLGGLHSVDSRIDLRTAFSEGLANAMAAITDGSGSYKDSRGNQQSNGFRLSLENANVANPNTLSKGWFNEDSSGQIVYDIYDDINEAGDTLAEGFTPIYLALTSESYRQGTASASIYSFVDALRTQLPESAGIGLDSLMLAQDISGSGAFGDGETNTGGSFDALPVYHELSPGDTINVCSSPVGGQYNGIGVRRLIRTFIEQDALHHINAAITIGSDGHRPKISIYQNSQALAEDAITETREFNDANFAVQLNAGEYLVEFYDLNNTDFDRDGERSCFDISLTTISSEA